MTVDATSIIDYTYDEFCKGIENITRQVRSSGFKPDYIVGIVRGGSVPAVYLSHALKVPVIMYHWSTRDYTNNQHDNAFKIVELIESNRKLLLVDDIIDGGITIKEVVYNWTSFSMVPITNTNMKIASMWYNTELIEANIIADYYDRAIDRNKDSRWVVMPWEVVK